MSDDMPGWASAMENRLQTRLAAVEDRLHLEATSLRVAVMERIDRLQNAMALIRDDIAVNFGAADTVKRANDNTREELRALGDVVSAMHRQINRLQLDVREMRGDP